MDGKEFEQFFKTNYPRFYFYAMQYIEEEEACKDIVSDCFAKIYPICSEFTAQQMLTYMYSTVRNRCLDSLRHQETEQKYVKHELQISDREIDDDQWLRRENILNIIYESIDELPTKTRDIIDLCFYQKKTYREAGEACGVSISAIRKHIMKAVKFFRNELKKNDLEW